MHISRVHSIWELFFSANVILVCWLRGALQRRSGKVFLSRFKVTWNGLLFSISHSTNLLSRRFFFASRKLPLSFHWEKRRKKLTTFPLQEPRGLLKWYARVVCQQGLHTLHTQSGIPGTLSDLHNTPASLLPRKPGLAG